MIYETFLCPSEFPTTSLNLKRALLSYDKIHIPDPADREYFPPQAFGMAIGMPPFLGINMGAVRPLGKKANYDNDFDRLMDEIDIARRQGLVDVTSSYDLSTSQKMTVGAVIMGNYPLNPQFLLWAYRNLCRDQAAIGAAITGDDHLFGLSAETVAEIAITQCGADGSINDDPALPSLNGPLARESLRAEFSVIARARTAAVIKTIGFCAAKQMVPTFGNASYGAVARHIANVAANVIDTVSTHDPYFAQRAEVLRIAHEEYVDETILDKMTVDDVLKLRTAAWGKQAQAREEMLRSVAEIGKEVSNSEKFVEIAQDRIRSYRSKAEELEKERAGLDLKIRCDFVAGFAGVGTAAASAGFFTQLQSAIGAATTLFAGCMYGANKIKEYGPVLQQLRTTEAEFKDDAAFGLQNFYSGLDKASRG